MYLTEVAATAHHVVSVLLAQDQLKFGIRLGDLLKFGLEADKNAILQEIVELRHLRIQLVCLKVLLSEEAMRASS